MGAFPRRIVGLSEPLSQQAPPAIRRAAPLVHAATHVAAPCQRREPWQPHLARGDIVPGVGGVEVLVLAQAAVPVALPLVLNLRGGRREWKATRGELPVARWAPQRSCTAPPCFRAALEACGSTHLHQQAERVGQEAQPLDPANPHRDVGDLQADQVARLRSGIDMRRIILHAGSQRLLLLLLWPYSLPPQPPTQHSRRSRRQA